MTTVGEDCGGGGLAAAAALLAHGFDRAAPGADVVRRARADRLRAPRGY